MWTILVGLMFLAIGLVWVSLEFPLGLVLALPVLILLYPFARLADFKWGKLKPLGELQRPTIAACAECKSELGVEGMILHSGLYYCATCKPVLMQKIAEGSKVGATVAYSGLRARWFWICLVFIVLALWLFLYCLKTFF
jgi:hypothetical protein